MTNMDAYKTLEERYAQFVGSKYAVSCNSGTSALHLALMALGVGVGDEVLVPDYTMAACAFAVSYTGATPVFYTGRPVPTKKTRALMVVHVYGRLSPLWDIGVPIIEDAAEAHGAVFDSTADITCYSFYKNKIIHAEEGGMCTTNNEKHAERMNYLKNMAFSPEHDYFHKEIGYNYRMPESQAVMVLDSLDKYFENASKRRQIELWYNEYFPTAPRDAVWFYDTVVPNKQEALQLWGVRDTFKNLSSFPMYGQSPVIDDGRVLLPCFPTLTREAVDNLCTRLLRMV